MSENEKPAYVPVAQVFVWMCLMCRHQFMTGSNDNVKCTKCGNWEFVTPIAMTIHFIYRPPTGGEGD